MKAKLTPLAVRTDRTDRECVPLLGGLIGALCLEAEVENVRNAVKWWAENKTAWDQFAQHKQPRAKGAKS